MKRILLGLALLLALLPSVASAHATLVSSDPADGASIPLASAPTQMTLTFSEEVAKDVTTVQVNGPAGAAMADGAATVDFDNPKLVTVKLKALTAGTYTAKWHAVTADDNGQTDGTVTFTIVGATSEGPTGSTASATATPTAPTSAAATLASFAHPLDKATEAKDQAAAQQAYQALRDAMTTNGAALQAQDAALYQKVTTRLDEVGAALAAGDWDKAHTAAADIHESLEGNGTTNTLPAAGAPGLPAGVLLLSAVALGLLGVGLRLRQATRFSGR